MLSSAGADWVGGTVVSSVSAPPLVGRSVSVCLAASHISTVADIAATDWLIAGVLASC
jgi:hypothetical protein